MTELSKHYAMKYRKTLYNPATDTPDSALGRITMQYSDVFSGFEILPLSMESNAAFGLREQPGPPMRVPLGVKSPAGLYLLHFPEYYKTRPAYNPYKTNEGFLSFFDVSEHISPGSEQTYLDGVSMAIVQIDFAGEVVPFRTEERNNIVEVMRLLCTVVLDNTFEEDPSTYSSDNHSFFLKEVIDFFSHC